MFDPVLRAPAAVSAPRRRLNAENGPADTSGHANTPHATPSATLSRALSLRAALCGRYTLLVCGRFFRHRPAEELAAAFRAKPGEGFEPRPASYNIPPSSNVLAVRYNPKTQERTLDSIQWGLIPYFASDRRFAYRTSNARADSIDTKPSYRSAFAKRRCLIPADGFYEWWTQGKGKTQTKHPYAFARRDHQPFAIAGVWENWRDRSTGEWVRSCALVTTDANPLVARIHDRMPVILHSADYARWLGEEPSSSTELKKLLKPYPAQEMIVWPVDRRLNRPDVDDVSVLDPLERDPLEDAPT